MAQTYREQIECELERLMQATGLIWQIEDTGGGCTAFMMIPDAGEPDAHYLITVADGADVPTSEAEWDDIALCYYSDSLGGDGFIIYSEVQTLADAVAFFENRGGQR